MSMQTRNAVGSAIVSGVLALAGIGCHTPPAVVGSPIPQASARPSARDGANVTWPAPAIGKTYHLLPTPQTVAWGYYSAAAKPVLTVNSGDEVIVRALSTCSPVSLVRAGLDSSRVEPEAKAIYAARGSMDTGPGGHILTGPIYVEGADSGDVLEVRFRSIKPAIDYACNSFNQRSGYLKTDFPGTSRSKIIELDTVRWVAHFPVGASTMQATSDTAQTITIPLHPFFGSVGVAPPASIGRVNSAPPGIHAGNLDNRELVAGSTLYIPVWTKGALLEIGDGHAGQGNGEVDITAMETSLIGDLQLVLHKNMHLAWPRAETPTHYIAMGIDADLAQATTLAIRNAIELLQDVKGMTREDAYQLLSVAGDVDVTQLVDGPYGVHVMIPKSIFAGRK